MQIKRKVVFMVLHSHLVKCQKENWAYVFLKYLLGHKMEKWEISVINLALRLANLDEFQLEGGLDG